MGKPSFFSKFFQDDSSSCNGFDFLYMGKLIYEEVTSLQKKDGCKIDFKENRKEESKSDRASVEFSKEISPKSKKDEKCK